MEPFNPDATTRAELMASRSRQFIALDARAAKGHLATPPLTRKERELVAQFTDIARDLARADTDVKSPDRPW
jgi:hypothetical protein